MGEGVSVRVSMGSVPFEATLGGKRACTQPPVSNSHGAGVTDLRRAASERLHQRDLLGEEACELARGVVLGVEEPHVLPQQCVKGVAAEPRRQPRRGEPKEATVERKARDHDCTDNKDCDGDAQHLSLVGWARLIRTIAQATRVVMAMCSTSVRMRPPESWKRAPMNSTT